MASVGRVPLRPDKVERGLAVLRHGLTAFIAYHDTQRCFESLDNLAAEAGYSGPAEAVVVRRGIAKRETIGNQYRRQRNATVIGQDRDIDVEHETPLIGRRPGAVSEENMPDGQQDMP